jgi:hypothetical protein
MFVVFKAVLDIRAFLRFNALGLPLFKDGLPVLFALHWGGRLFFPFLWVGFIDGCEGGLVKRGGLGLMDFREGELGLLLLFHHAVN